MTNRPVAGGGDCDDDLSGTRANRGQRLIRAHDALDRGDPSPSVWERISECVDQIEASRGSLTVSSTEGVWDHVSPGVHRKLLHVDVKAGWQSFLLRVEPGSGIPPHAHPGLEECLVLEGEFEVDGAVVRKGDLHLAFAGHDHGPLTSSTGALLYLRVADA